MWNKNLLKETNWAWSWVVILSAKELTQIRLQFPPRQERQVKRVLSDRGDLLRLHLMLLLFSSAPWRQEQQLGELSGYHLMLSHHFVIFSWERTASQMECHTGLNLISVLSMGSQWTVCRNLMQKNLQEMLLYQIAQKSHRRKMKLAELKVAKIHLSRRFDGQFITRRFCDTGECNCFVWIKILLCIYFFNFKSNQVYF